MTKKKVQLVSMVSRETRKALDRAKRQRKTTLSALVEAAIVAHLRPASGPMRPRETK